MKILILILLFILPVQTAAAQEKMDDPFASIDLSGFETFAEENDAGISIEQIKEMLVSDELPNLKDLKQIVGGYIFEPIRQLSGFFVSMLFPGLMLAIMSAAFPKKYHSAGFICRILLARSGALIFTTILGAANQCLSTTSAFADVASPILVAILTAAGKTASASLMPPAATLAGNLIEKIFTNCGLPVCAIAGCFALASNLSETNGLNRLFSLVKKLFNWGTGLSLTLFTALILLKSNAASVSDSLAVRTAKYAVDSITPVIGSGVSDAWDSYLSGLKIARSTVGFSGAILLLSVCIKPMLSMGAAMIVLSILSSAFEIADEKSAARSFEQLSSACQMALSLCGGAMAVWIILMGAMLSVGGGLL